MHQQQVSPGDYSVPLPSLFPSSTTPVSAAPDTVLTRCIGTKRDKTQERAENYALTKQLSGILLPLNSQLQPAYKKALSCNWVKLTTGGQWRATGRFCKLFWCAGCARKRSHRFCYEYLPLLEAWENPQFLTLTIGACSAQVLPAQLEYMKQVFERIRDRWRQQTKRVHEIPLVCLRALEVTAYSARATFHPHFHFILPDVATAQKLLAEWQQEVAVAAAAQHLTACYDRRGLLYYLTKPPVDFQRITCEAAEVYDVIFQNLQSYRLFQAYGLRRARASLKTERAAAQLRQELEHNYGWDATGDHWVNKVTGEILVSSLRH